MKTDMVDRTCREWLQKNLGITFEEAEAMNDEQRDKLCNDLLMLECDALDGDRDDLEIIDKVQDIIFDGEPDEDEDDETE